MKNMHFLYFSYLPKYKELFAKETDSIKKSDYGPAENSQGLICSLSEKLCQFMPPYAVVPIPSLLPPAI